MNDPERRETRKGKQEPPPARGISRNRQWEAYAKLGVSRCTNVEYREKAFVFFSRRERAPHFLDYGTLIAVLFTMVGSLSLRYFRNLTCGWRRSHLQLSGISPIPVPVLLSYISFYGARRAPVLFICLVFFMQERTETSPRRTANLFILSLLRFRFFWEANTKIRATYMHNLIMLSEIFVMFYKCYFTLCNYL